MENVHTFYPWDAKRAESSAIVTRLTIKAKRLVDLMHLTCKIFWFTSCNLPFH